MAPARAPEVKQPRGLPWFHILSHRGGWVALGCRYCPGRWAIPHRQYRPTKPAECPHCYRISKLPPVEDE